jgi:nucleoside recognition membrane protein YjiH
VFKCPDILITGLNVEQLEHVHIFKCSKIHTLKLSSSTSKFKELYAETVELKPILEPLFLQTTLRQLTLTNIRDNADVDLSRQNQLQTLKVDGCPGLVITGLNTDHLEQVDIFQCPKIGTLKLSSNTSKFKELCAEGVKLKPILEPLLLQTTLRQLTLTNIRDNADVDLSRQNQLQTLKVDGCPGLVIQD